MQTLRSTAGPRVSVLLPFRNGEEYLGAAMESILGQDFEDFELLAFDDGSTDGAPAIARRLADRDARVRVFSRENKGLVATLNELIELSTAPYLARMDADDVALPGRLRRQVDALDRDPALVAVGSAVRFVDPEGDPLLVEACGSSHEEIVGWFLQPGSRGLGLAHPATMLRAGAVRQLGGYRAEFWPAEDVDFFLRLGEVGRLANVAEVLLDYRIHPKSISRQHAQRQADAHRAASNSARCRVGLALLPPAADPPGPSGPALPQSVEWAWWALSSGFVASARKHAMAALREAPLRAEAWRVALCALRGH